MQQVPQLEPENLRTAELINVRLKLMQLIDALTEMTQMHPATPWPTMHAQFTTLISRYTAIQRELSGPYLKQLLAHPFVLPQQDPDFIPRVLLRSKLIPELELKAPVPSINILDETAIKQAIQHAQLQLELHDDIVKEAEKALNEAKEEYDFTARLQDDEMEEDEPASLTINTQPSTNMDSFTPENETALLSLMVRFVSSGKRPPTGTSPSSPI